MNTTMTTNTTEITIKDAPHWMDCEERFRFWEKNGISSRDRAKQIALTLEEYTDVPEWELRDAKERFVAWIGWFSDFCYRVNANA